MKSKLDMRLLYPIISLLSFKDEKYSKFIAELLLKALNSTDEIEDKSLVLNVIIMLFRTWRHFCWLKIRWALNVSSGALVFLSWIAYLLVTHSSGWWSVPNPKCIAMWAAFSLPRRINTHLFSIVFLTSENIIIHSQHLESQCYWNLSMNQPLLDSTFSVCQLQPISINAISIGFKLMQKK